MRVSLQHGLAIRPCNAPEHPPRRAGTLSAARGGWYGLGMTERDHSSDHPVSTVETATIIARLVPLRRRLVAARYDLTERLRKLDSLERSVVDNVLADVATLAEHPYAHDGPTLEQWLSYLHGRIDTYLGTVAEIHTP